MKEMTLEETHHVAFEIMKEIHEFCVNNNIQYSLAYGSLLGAIRHKGFIPWDDDIDIWMTRPNFEKFSKTFKSNKGYRHLSVYDKDSLICYDRVYETKNTYVKNMPKACDGKTGIWVDVMPLDYAPDDTILRDSQYKEFAELNKKVDIYRGWRTILESQSLIIIAKTFVKKIITGEIRYLRRKVVSDIHNSKLKLIKKYTNTPSSYYCYFQCGVLYRNEKQELLPSRSFDYYQLTKFEDTEFMIVKDYDTLLKTLFNDYMTPPPVEQRKKSHGICLWR